MQSRRSGFFSKTSIYKERDLKFIAPTKDYNFMKSNTRGFGFWLWKPMIVLDFLEKNPEIDFIVYLDSGCDINYNEQSKNQFESYFSLLEKSQCICFAMELIEGDWTKREIINQLAVTEREISSPQILGGVFMMERNFAVRFCLNWLENMRTSNYTLLDNSFDPVIQTKNFKEPRHDQSIFSILIKREKQVSILRSEDHVYFHPKWDSGTNFPFWTSRNKSFLPFKHQGRISNFLRLVERAFLRCCYIIIRVKKGKIGK